MMIGLAVTLISVTIGAAPELSGQSVAVRTAGTQPVQLMPVTIDVVDAPLMRVLEAIARQSGLRESWNDRVFGSTVLVSLHVREVPADVAFAKALSGTGMQAVIVAKRVNIVKDAQEAPSGIISGTVRDEQTRQPVRGAAVLVDESTRGVMTGSDGVFKITSVSPGDHRITIRLIGYLRQVRTVHVNDGETVPVDVVLALTGSVLDQVVVTGTVIPTELKAVPNAITIITAKQIEERGITKIDQLFRGDVPGIFAQNLGAGAALDEVTMFSRGATALSSFSAGTTAPGGGTTFTNPIKTYVDGVELADPRYLSQIDPKSIERIEILTGPQASTIYGSNAINGVMQIFTKRGATAAPQLTLNLLSGWVENDFSSARTPQHDYSAQLSGVEGRISYNGGGSWNYVGPWTPSKQTTRTGVFEGTRLELPTALGPVTADMTFRLGNTQSRQRGDQNQSNTNYTGTGWYRYSVYQPGGRSAPVTYMLNGQTLGFTLGYTPTNWWSHELGVGQDASATEERYSAQGNLDNTDTTLFLTQTHTGRRSLRYSTTAKVPVTSLVQATVTVGADAWQSLTSSMRVFPQTLTGTLTSTSYDVERQPEHNTGAFLQTQFGVQDRLFVTYGLRAEWNHNFGAEAQPNYAPRYGVAYTQDVGVITAKLRASYGRSTRPPTAGVKAATFATDAGYTAADVNDYGNFVLVFANPELAPEHQQGGEGGLELYWGTRGSLVITRYNQTVDGLIEDVGPVDSIRSLAPNPPSGSSDYVFDANGYGYRWQFQYLNVGSIRNQGWELQSSVNTGPFTTHGTYSWTKSRTIGVNPAYRKFFANALGYPQYQPGATFDFLPEHTWAVGTTYERAQTTVVLNVTGTGRLRNLQDELYLHSLTPAVRLLQNRLNMNYGNGYVSFNDGYALADLTASHRFSSHLEGVLQVQNLADRYTNDKYAGYATMGRQSKVGVRIRL